MHYKNDWDRAKNKLAALWHGTSSGRPCISAIAPHPGGEPWPALPENPEDRWMNPEWVIPHLRAQLSNTWWGGEAIPSYIVMGGWVVSAGGIPHFSQETIWFDTFDVDFQKPSPFTVREDDPWLLKHRKLYAAVAMESTGEKFLLGSPCFLPANDLLSMHMGTEHFMFALMDEPAWMQAAILQAAQQLAGERQRLNSTAQKCTSLWYGLGGWMPFWAPEPFIATQSDVSCMLSPDAFEQFVVPELDFMGRTAGAMWYHLDGHDARQHLPRLLSLPYLHVIQYTPTPSEPPNGPEHLDFYKAVQKAGRILHISLPPQNVAALAGKLDPALLMLDVYCASESEGQAVIEHTERW